MLVMYLDDKLNVKKWLNNLGNRSSNITFSWILVHLQ